MLANNTSSSASMIYSGGGNSTTADRFATPSPMHPLVLFLTTAVAESTNAINPDTCSTRGPRRQIYTNP
ncbi:hypothetical protein BT67DRAFT_156272 [Trichocladium antarcticum]|uniref:Uncharacterized protein n=1 Tax=Trichocladium antarcticum TaxID=1450529 RepID=A0AAN6ZAU8_9PEZI|nr:hypothetical protein BT67DRAFT_156272 [Trichocladium antarcticum]